MKNYLKKPIVKIGFIILLLIGISFLNFGIYILYSNGLVNTYNVSNFQELKTAAADTAEKNIVFTNSFEITETINLQGVTNISASDDITISRNESFLDDMFNIQENANVTFSKTEDNVLTIDGNNVVSTGIAFRNNENATLTLGAGLEIINFNSTSSGTVVFNHGNLIINGANIYNNKMTATADKYGIIHSYTDSTFKFNSGNFYNNTTTLTGVLFLNNQSSFEMTGGKIYNNTTSASGGGFYIKSATAKFNGGEIYGNSAETGGGIYTNDNAIVEINGTQIYQNTVNTYGAGLYLTGNSKVTLNSGKIENNTSTKSGAGLFITSSSTFNMNGGEIKDNQNESGNGGAFVNKSNANIFGGTISLNTAVGKGGAIYNDTGILKIKNTAIMGNTAGTFGGAVCNEEGSVEILSGTFTQNSAENGGAVCGYSKSNTTISGGSFSSNTASNRGADVYGAGSSTSNFSTITLIGGEFQNINIQYCLLKIGGSVKVNNLVTFNAGKKAKYARIEVVSELENEITISSHSSVVAEDLNTEVKFIKYTATDSYSNIYKTARKIKFNNSLYTTVESNTILVSTGEFKVNIAQDICVVNAPLSASENEIVTFSALREYQISNVTVTAEDNSTIATTLENGVYSFTMPAQNVSINYTYSLSPLPLQVDATIADLIQVNSTYTFKENVNITILDNDNQKLTALYINLNGQNTKLEIVNNQTSFKMFNGAILTGEIKNYYNISFTQNENITNVMLNSEKQNKGLEGETITFGLTVGTPGEVNRYGIKSVYYMDGNDKILISKNNEFLYEFVMPSKNVEINYEFVDIFENIQGKKVIVKNETELISALTSESSTIILYNDIVLTQTIKLAEGEFTIISLGDNTILRATSLKTNMFEIGYKTTLNLSINSNIAGKLTISGNIEEDTIGTAFYVYNSGVLNINSNTSIKNHNLKTQNFIYTTLNKGNDNAGGSAIYNFNGIVNMFGGEICNNYSTQNGSAVYNYGRFNLYGGSVHSNLGEDGGTIYNLRIFNQEGGVIENNTNNSYGGAIYSANTHHAYAYILGGEIKNNTALKSGGAIYVGEKGVLWCKGGEIKNNTATNNGGAINSKGTLFVTGTTFTNNTAGSKGGAIYGYCKPVFIRGGMFANNSANNGGAICVNDGVELEISAGEFTQNTASTRGGAVYLSGDKTLDIVTTATITGGTFTNNTASEGSAICIQYAVAKFGGDVLIEGVVEIVSNPTQKYAYIEIISQISNIISFKPNKLVDDYQTEEFNVIRISSDVLAELVNPKLQIVDTEYSTKVIDNQIYIYKLV